MKPKKKTNIPDKSLKDAWQKYQAKKKQGKEK
jgi:hypothetical protein